MKSCFLYLFQKPVGLFGNVERTVYYFHGVHLSLLPHQSNSSDSTLGQCHWGWNELMIWFSLKGRSSWFCSMVCVLQDFSLLCVLEILSKQHLCSLGTNFIFNAELHGVSCHSSKSLTSAIFEMQETRQFLPSFQQGILSTKNKVI